MYDQSLINIVTILLNEIRIDINELVLLQCEKRIRKNPNAIQLNCF